MRPVVRWMVAAWLCCWPALSQAEPRFALREGMRCAHCHTNHTGGGMRTRFGNTFAQTNLASFRTPGAWDPWLGSRVAVGANVRLANVTSLAARTQLGAQRWEIETTNTFEMREANVYLRGEVVPDRLMVYLDETVGPEGASARELFVQLHGLPLGTYVKAGRFLLPFGLRVPDDVTFTRQLTGFTYANQDLGIEAGMAPHPFSLSVALSNGTLGGDDLNLAKAVTTTADVVWGWGRFGLSFAWNDTSSDDQDSQAFITGGHLGVRLGRLTTFAEFDWLRGEGSAGTFDQWSLLAAADFEAVKGLWIQFAFEAHDPDMALSDNERDRFVMGLSWFPIPLLEVRAQYRLNRDIPQRPAGNADQVFVEIQGLM